MFVVTWKFNRKTAVFVVLMAALVLIGIVLLAGAHSKAQALETSQRPVTTVKNDKTRAAYLRQYGWEVETPAVSESKVLIPRSFTEVLEAYNELQKEQGFDLTRYCGMEVELYTYKVLNYENEDYVVAQLYVLDNDVIAGDVHSTELGGFMVGIKSGDTVEKSKT